MRISDWSSDVCSSDLLSIAAAAASARIDNGLSIGSSHSAQIGGKWLLGVGSRSTGCDGSRLKSTHKMRALDHRLQMYKLGYKPVHLSFPGPENASYWAIKSK